jgi:CheY-like chemotaxis protein
MRTLQRESSTFSCSQRLLVVDDNRDAADSLAMFLANEGTEVRVAYDGPRSLEILDVFEPTVVLLDLGMPGMDGFEVARQIRQQRRFQSLTLIALTGWGQEEDRRRCSAAGFDHHLVKPVDLAVLQRLLAFLEDRSGNQPE